MKTRTKCLSVAAALIAVLLGSCTPDGGSIYFILENERAQPLSTLGSTITVFDVARLGSTYFAAANTIFQGAIDGTSVTWVSSGASNPLGTLPAVDARCNALAAFGGNLWGGFRTDSGNLGLYTAAGSDFTAAGGGVQVIAAGLQDQEIIRLKVSSDGSRLLIISADMSASPFKYCLTAYNGAYTQLITPADAVTSMIRDADYNPAGAGTYYAVSGNDLYSGAGPLTPTNVLGGFTIGETEKLQGIHTDGANIIISSKSSGIYVSVNNGAAWTNLPADTQLGAAVSYLGISGPLSGSLNYAIGSEAYGYYYLKPPYTALARSADTSMKTLKLYGAVILRFFVDGSTIFACTSGDSLWKGILDAANDSGVDTSSWKIQ